MEPTIIVAAVAALAILLIALGIASSGGSGVTARLAAMHAKGEIGLGEERIFESIVGSRFSGSVVRETREGPHKAIVANVGGRAFYSGRADFRLEGGDDLGQGFLVR